MRETAVKKIKRLRDSGVREVHFYPDGEGNVGVRPVESVIRMLENDIKRFDRMKGGI